MTMGNGKSLSDSKPVKEEGLNNLEKAKKIGKSANIVDHFIRKENSYGKMSPGRMTAMLDRDKFCHFKRRNQLGAFYQNLSV